MDSEHQIDEAGDPSIWHVRAHDVRYDLLGDVNMDT
jgi:hypothetical protein